MKWFGVFSLALLAATPQGIPFQGVYENHFGYAYRVTLPPGLTGWKTPAPAPQHGFAIDSVSGARISVDGSYNTLDLPSARAAAASHVGILRAEQLSPPRFRHTKLAGLPAVEVTVHYRDAPTNTSRERRHLIALRSAPPVGIIYEIVFDAPIPLSRQWLRTYTALAHSFQLTPLPK